MMDTSLWSAERRIWFHHDSSLVWTDQNRVQPIEVRDLFHVTHLCWVWLYVTQSCACSTSLPGFQPCSRSFTDEGLSVTCTTRPLHPHGQRNRRKSPTCRHIKAIQLFMIERLPQFPTIHHILCVVHHLCLSLRFLCATCFSVKELSARVTRPESRTFCQSCVSMLSSSWRRRPKHAWCPRWRTKEISVSSVDRPNDIFFTQSILLTRKSSPSRMWWTAQRVSLNNFFVRRRCQLEHWLATSWGSIFLIFLWETHTTDGIADCLPLSPSMQHTEHFACTTAFYRTLHAHWIASYPPGNCTGRAGSGTLCLSCCWSTTRWVFIPTCRVLWISWAFLHRNKHLWANQSQHELALRCTPILWVTCLGAHGAVWANQNLSLKSYLWVLRVCPENALCRASWTMHRLKSSCRSGIHTQQSLCSSALDVSFCAMSSLIAATYDRWHMWPSHARWRNHRGHSRRPSKQLFCLQSLTASVQIPSSRFVLRGDNWETTSTNSWSEDVSTEDLCHHKTKDNHSVSSFGLHANSNSLPILMPAVIPGLWSCGLRLTRASDLHLFDPFNLCGFDLSDPSFDHSPTCFNISNTRSTKTVCNKASTSVRKTLHRQLHSFAIQPLSDMNTPRAECLQQQTPLTSQWHG